MENKIMQLLMEKGEVSMNNDIFPILFEEFGNAPRMNRPMQWQVISYHNSCMQYM